VDQRPPCKCLLCAEPRDESTWDERDRTIAANVERYGWSVSGVHGDDELPGWAYSIGMYHTLRSPEVAVFGLPPGTGMRIVNIVGEQIRDGRPVRQDEQRDDVLTGYPVAFRAVQLDWSPTFFGAGMDFYRLPYLPVVQVFWPDREGRFPWDPSVEETCRSSQPMLWLDRDDHPPGPWTTHDPKAGWAFADTLPYQAVSTTPRVRDGAADVVHVSRDADGHWHFLDAEVTGGDEVEEVEEVEVALREIVTGHPHVTGAAALVPGTSAWRDDTGRWRYDKRP
jgi:hypothetical protein